MADRVPSNGMGGEPSFFLTKSHSCMISHVFEIIFYNLSTMVSLEISMERLFSDVPFAAIGLHSILSACVQGGPTVRGLLNNPFFPDQANEGSSSQGGPRACPGFPWFNFGGTEEGAALQ